MCAKYSNFYYICEEEIMNRIIKPEIFCDDLQCNADKRQTRHRKIVKGYSITGAPLGMFTMCNVVNFNNMLSSLNQNTFQF